MTWKQAAFLAAKVLCAIAVLTWLFHKVDISRVWNLVSEARPVPVLLGIVFCLLTVAIAGWRWKRLLAIVQIEVPLGSLICIAQIGQFFLMFLPGPVGDDLTRMLYISRLAKGRAGEACSTVLLDRCIGLSSLLLLAVLCVPWQWRLLATSRQTSFLAFGILAAGILLCALGAVFFVSGAPTHAWFGSRLRYVPSARLRDEAERLWGLLCTNKPAIAQVLGAALLTQFLCCSFVYLAGISVGANASPLVWFGFMPIVLAANTVPITVAGFGVREYLLVLFLGVLAGVPRESALAVSFVAFSMMLASSLVGGVVYLIYRPRKNCFSSSP